MIICRYPSGSPRAAARRQTWRTLAWCMFFQVDLFELIIAVPWLPCETNVLHTWSVNPEGLGTAGFADRTEQSVSDSSSARSAKYADIAQLVEQRPFKAWVGGVD